MKKTNAMRVLDAAGAPYTVLSYEVDTEHLDAQSAAQKLGIDPYRMFKTIAMLSAGNEVFIFCVPACCEVGLKKIKRITGQKILPLKLSELQKTTGYIRGGCSPIAMKKPFPVFVDETALLHERIYINAGERGVMLCMKAEDLPKVCRAQFCDIAE